MTERANVGLADVDSARGARFAGRAAQLLLGIPLGLFQLGAVLAFTFTGAVVTPTDWFVAVWGIAMSATCALLALKVYRSARARLIAFALLGVQVAFSFVKGFVYHETAALVFGTIVVVTLVALGVYHRAAAADEPLAREG